MKYGGVVLALAVLGCSSGTTCGTGTVQQGDQCVAANPAGGTAGGPATNGSPSAASGLPVNTVCFSTDGFPEQCRSDASVIREVETGWVNLTFSWSSSHLLEDLGLMDMSGYDCAATFTPPAECAQLIPSWGNNGLAPLYFYNLLVEANIPEGAAMPYQGRTAAGTASFAANCLIPGAPDCVDNPGCGQSLDTDPTVTMDVLTPTAAVGSFTLSTIPYGERSPIQAAQCGSVSVRFNWTF